MKASYQAVPQQRSAALNRGEGPGGYFEHVSQTHHTCQIGFTSLPSPYLGLDFKGQLSLSDRGR